MRWKRSEASLRAKGPRQNERVLEALMGLGLATAAGLNAYIPLLVLVGLVLFGWFVFVAVRSTRRARPAGPSP
jgi:hypothetical protein